MKLGTLNNGNQPAPITAAWAAPQCTAKAKSTRQQCRCRATRYSIEQFGRPLCYLHGGAKGSGQVTPEGKRRIAQAQLKHGHFTKEAVAERIRERRELKEYGVPLKYYPHKRKRAPQRRDPVTGRFTR